MDYLKKLIELRMEQDRVCKEKMAEFVKARRLEDLKEEDWNIQSQ